MLPHPATSGETHIYPLQDSNFAMKTNNETESFVPLAISIKQTCETLGLSRHTVNELIKSKQIHSRRVGTRILVSYQSILSWMRQKDDQS